MLIVHSGQYLYGLDFLFPLLDVGECPLDPGGYFVIKGTEKVKLLSSYGCISFNMRFIEKMDTLL